MELPAKQDGAQLPSPQADERTMAMLAHFLVRGFLDPVFILAVKRDSSFGAFHAVQALLWQVIVGGVTMLCVLA